MREIKFRGYDKTAQKMIDWKGLYLDKDYGDDEFYVGYRYSLCETRFDHDVVLMQYTGLKDKNGKEIYEGDVYQHSEDKRDLSMVCFGEFGVPNIEDETYQDKAIGFYFKPIGSKAKIEPFNMTGPVNSTYVKKGCVIGNIHENSELIL